MRARIKHDAHIKSTAKVVCVIAHTRHCYRKKNAIFTHAVVNYIVELVLVDVDGDEVTVTVRGGRFLYKMVRRIVGAMVACGSGRLTQRDIRAALAGKHCRPFTTAPAHGLLLDSVEYQ